MKQTIEPLYRSCYGHMDDCPQRGGFWLTFGEMQLWLCQERLRQFARKVNRLVAVINPTHELGGNRQLPLCPPGRDGEMVYFSPDELVDLQTLLNGSLVMIDLTDFLIDNQFRLKTNT